ncbi:hypothetical protein [Halopiger goleimassiliensis]|uniref:hypothetical protein n=1 Tax=Halopiger goleimassiliensis TaxID=1293048 RepID=UPI00067827A0|nr:hypothetical protein [Halopiger goleimassiliensis]
MAWDDAGEDPESLREDAERYEEIVAGLEDLVAELREESVKGSRLEELYDQVTTANPNLWNIATAFIDVEDGEATVSDVSKLAQGKWAPEIVEDCDAMVTLEIQRGLMPDDFTYLVSRELEDEIDAFREEAASARQRAAELEADEE